MRGGSWRKETVTTKLALVGGAGFAQSGRNGDEFERGAGRRGDGK